MIASLLSLVLAQAPTIQTRPVTSAIPSRPRYEVDCELKDLDSQRTFRLALTQYGGVYVQPKGRDLGGRLPTYVKFRHDDLEIFGRDETKLLGQVTDWYSDGPIELIANEKRGGLTIYKTAESQAWLDGPTTIAVTAKGGRYIRDAQGDSSWDEFILLGTCEVSWTEQKQTAAAPQGSRKES